MKAYLINMHLLVPRSRSSAKLKVKYEGYISQKMAFLGALVFHKHILFYLVSHASDGSTIFLLTFCAFLHFRESPLQKDITCQLRRCYTMKNKQKLRVKRTREDKKKKQYTGFVYDSLYTVNGMGF